MPTPSSPESPQPTADERRRAVIAAMAQGPGLVRFAARYTHSVHDAEDAYQRAMEIALLRAPVVEPKAFLAWLHTVIKNEALTICRRSRFEAPADGDDLSTSLADRVGQTLGADAVAEWRERYRGLRSALNALTEAQRVCLMLKSAGVSHAEIAEMTGFSARKVERSILEGRTALHGWELKMERGDECARVLPALHRVAEDEATAREERAVGRHVKGCPSCRAVLARRRDRFQGLASLVPVALLAAPIASAGPPDPSLALGWWDRMASGATVRAGTTWQHVVELPGLLGTKVGAGAAAAVVAGAAGGPFVADAVRGGDAGPVTRAVPISRQVAVSNPPPVALKSTTSPGRRAPHRTAAVQHPARRATPKTPTTTRTVHVVRRIPSPPAVVVRRPTPAPVPPPAPPASSAALEFGP